MDVVTARLHSDDLFVLYCALLVYTLYIKGNSQCSLRMMEICKNEFPSQTHASRKKSTSKIFDEEIPNLMDNLADVLRVNIKPVAIGKNLFQPEKTEFGTAIV